MRRLTGRIINVGSLESKVVSKLQAAHDCVVGDVPTVGIMVVFISAYGVFG
jgi:hypothetical protein